MKVFAQQGHGTGSGESDRIVAGLSRGFIHGAIISPKDYGIDRTRDLLIRLETEFPDADRLFDPQFYASVVAHDPNSRMGRLLTDDYPYFQPRRRTQLEREATVHQVLEECLRFQAALSLSAAIAPGIVIRQRFNSVDAVIARSFIRDAAQVWASMADGRPIYATLAVDAEALQDRNELDEFLAELTILDSRPTGFYVLVHRASSEIPPELIDHRAFAGWMLINHVLRINGFEVINGYSDMLAPFLAAAGGSACATGWFTTQKVFSLSRFGPAPAGGSRPVYRYLSKALLNSLRVDELHALRRAFPEVLNGLQTDSFYDESDGSLPDNQVAEVLQTWETISSFASAAANPTLRECLSWIGTARDLYERIKFAPGIRLSGRSNDEHLAALEAGLALFAELAEIDLCRE